MAWGVGLRYYVDIHCDGRMIEAGLGRTIFRVLLEPDWTMPRFIVRIRNCTAPDGRAGRNRYLDQLSENR